MAERGLHIHARFGNMFENGEGASGGTDLLLTGFRRFDRASNWLELCYRPS